MIYQILITYLLLINLVTLSMFGIDKWKAKHNKWRIPETTLLTISVIGGSIGALCGMRIFHHKTLHKKFYIGVPVILVLQAIAAYCYFSPCPTALGA